MNTDQRHRIEDYIEFQPRRVKSLSLELSFLLTHQTTPILSFFLCSIYSIARKRKFHPYSWKACIVYLHRFFSIQNYVYFILCKCLQICVL